MLCRWEMMGRGFSVEWCLGCCVVVYLFLEETFGQKTDDKLNAQDSGFRVWDLQICEDTCSRLGAWSEWLHGVRMSVDRPCVPLTVSSYLAPGFPSPTTSLVAAVAVAVAVLSWDDGVDEACCWAQAVKECAKARRGRGVCGSGRQECDSLGGARPVSAMLGILNGGEVFANVIGMVTDSGSARRRRGGWR